MRRFLEASYAADTGTILYPTTAGNLAQDTATSFSVQPTTVSSRVYINAAGLFLQDNWR